MGLAFGWLRRSSCCSFFCTQLKGGQNHCLYRYLANFIYAAGACCLYFRHSQSDEPGFWRGCTKNWVRQILHGYSIWCQCYFLFLKQVLGGAFITIAMTGLDQEMMQKTSVWRHWQIHKNMFTPCHGVVGCQLFVFGYGWLIAFVCPGKRPGSQGRRPVSGHSTGGLFVTNHWVVFIIGLISALFPSADGALTALTSSFCIDLLDIKTKNDWSEEEKKKRRWTVHISFAVLFSFVWWCLKWIDDKSIIDVILKLAGYTYGPLLGLFSLASLPAEKSKTPWCCGFALFRRRWFWALILSTMQSGLPAKWDSQAHWPRAKDPFSKHFHGFKLGIEILILNGMLTFAGLWMISQKEEV